MVRAKLGPTLVIVHMLAASSKSVLNQNCRGVQHPESVPQQEVYAVGEQIVHRRSMVVEPRSKAVACRRAARLGSEELFPNI